MRQWRIEMNSRSITNTSILSKNGLRAKSSSLTFLGDDRFPNEENQQRKANWLWVYDQSPRKWTRSECMSLCNPFIAPRIEMICSTFMTWFSRTDTSYTRQNIKIDHEGIKAQDEQKSNITPKQNSFIKDISEIVILDALGNGASGYVSQAMHIPTQKLIAIKVRYPVWRVPLKSFLIDPIHSVHSPMFLDFVIVHTENIRLRKEPKTSNYERIQCTGKRWVIRMYSIIPRVSNVSVSFCCHQPVAVVQNTDKL